MISSELMILITSSFSPFWLNSQFFENISNLHLLMNIDSTICNISSWKFKAIAVSNFENTKMLEFFASECQFHWFGNIQFFYWWHFNIDITEDTVLKHQICPIVDHWQFLHTCWNYLILVLSLIYRYFRWSWQTFSMILFIELSIIISSTNNVPFSM